MRIVFLTHYYPPEAGAPQQRLEALSQALSDRGADVTVHTGFPHYPAGAVRAPYRNRLVQRERQSGVNVVRSAVYPAANRGVVRRLADHAVFAASALATGSAAGPADVVVVESPPLFLAAAAPAYARARRGRLILQVSDLWPDSAVQVGAVRNEHAIRAARVLERHAYRRASAVVVPTEGIQRTLEGRPETAGKVSRIPPAVDLERFDPRPVRRTGALRVLYAGTVGLAQGIGTLVEAARLLGPDLIRVVICGDGAELAEVRTAAARLEHVEVLGPVPAGDVPRLYSESDVGVVLLRDRPVFKDALPTKLFEAMAAARPVALSAHGEAARIVATGGVGVVVPPERPDALAAALRGLAQAPESRLRAMGSRGRALAGQFDRMSMVNRWWALLKSVERP